MAKMTPEQVLSELTQPSAQLPEAALLAALAHPEEHKAGLIQLIEQAALQPGTLAPDALGHHYAMVLLAYQKAPEAFHPLLELLSLPAELVDYVLASSLEQRLARCLASSAHLRVESLQQAAYNANNYEYCRLAAIKALKILYLQSEWSRPALISFYQQLIAGLPRQLEAFPWDLLAAELLEIHPQGLVSELRAMFKEGLIPPFFLSLESFEKALHQDLEQTVQLAQAKPENQFILEPLTEIRKFAPDAKADL